MILFNLISMRLPLYHKKNHIFGVPTFIGSRRVFFYLSFHCYFFFIVIVFFFVNVIKLSDIIKLNRVKTWVLDFFFINVYITITSFFYRLRKIKSARSMTLTTYLVYVYIFTYTIHDFTSCENGRGDIKKKKKAT